MKRSFTLIAVGLLAGWILITGCQQPEVAGAKIYLGPDNYDPDKAVEQAKIAIEKVPEDPEAHYVLGRAYGEKRMYREMNEAFKKSLELSQKFASEIEQYRLKYWIDIFNDGVASIKQDKLKEAVDKFELAVELLPDRVDAYKNLAFAYAQMNDIAQAIETYQKAIGITPEDLELKSYLGLLYYRNKEYEKSIEVLNEVIAKADPNSKEYAEALHNIAVAYDLMGQSDKAIEAYQNALASVPNNADLMFNLGRLYFMKEDYENAIESFKKVLEQTPDDFDSNLNIGNAYLQQENFEEAIPYFKKAVEIKPDNANAWNNLGVAYVRTGMTEEGKAAFEKADALRGGN